MPFPNSKHESGDNRGSNGKHCMNIRRTIVQWNIYNVAASAFEVSCWNITCTRTAGEEGNITQLQNNIHITIYLFLLLQVQQVVFLFTKLC